jgi:hypothetical protein
MVRKFVFVPGPEPYVAPRRIERSAGASKAMQWLLLGLALTVSAVGFSLAKSTAAESHAALAR